MELVLPKLQPASPEVELLARIVSLLDAMFQVQMRLATGWTAEEVVRDMKLNVPRRPTDKEEETGGPLDYQA